MGSSLADLDQRDVARVRVELAEAIAAHFAYPTFFDYHAGAPRMRPLSAARAQEIAQFTQLADLGAIERADLTSPQVRRFLERFLQRHLEMNADLARAPARQRLALMRVAVPRVAADLQRGLVAFAAGTSDTPGGYGVARPRVSWRGTGDDRATVDATTADQNAALIQAALLPRRDAPPAPPASAPAAPDSTNDPASIATAPRPIMSAAPVAEVSTFWGGYPAPLDGHAGNHHAGNHHAGNGFATSQEQTAPQPVVNAADQSAADAEPDAALDLPTLDIPTPFNSNGNGNGHAAHVAPAGWAALLHELSGPLPALPAERPPAVPSSPFLGLEGGAQSGIFGALPANPFSAAPRELPPVNSTTNSTTNRNGHRDPFSESFSDDTGETDPRKLPPGLVEMYSAYLRALRPGPAPDAAPADVPSSVPTEPPVPPASRAQSQAASARGRSTPPPEREPDLWARSTMPPAPTSAPSGIIGAAPGMGGDQMIFAQLRNQLDAYLRATAYTAGIPVDSSDPEQVLGILRRNGRLSAADVRLAENILAITGRVLAGGTATPDDYRQAFMLYLLYHRGRVGA